MTQPSTNNEEIFINFYDDDVSHDHDWLDCDEFFCLYQRTLTVVENYQCLTNLHSVV